MPDESTSTPNENVNAMQESVNVPINESVPISEAAEQLGITRSHLQRLLKRPEFSAGVSHGQRQTTRGMRTVTLVSVTVLEAIDRVISEQKHEQNGQNHYHSDQAENSVQIPPLAMQLLSEREARMADKDAEIQRLTRALTETQSALRLAQENLAREQTQRSLPPAAHAPEAFNNSVGSTEADAGRTGERVVPRAKPEGAPGRKQDQDVWARLKRWFFNA